MNDEERNALIEELRHAVYSNHSSLRIVMEARKIIDRIPQRYHTYVEAGTNDPTGDFITE